MDLIRGPTKARTWGRRIMSPSQTINHNSPHQPATVRPVVGVQSEWKVLSNGVSEQIKETSNIFSHPIYTTPHFAFNSIEEIYGSVMNYFI